MHLFFAGSLRYCFADLAILKRLASCTSAQMCTLYPICDVISSCFFAFLVALWAGFYHQYVVAIFISKGYEIIGLHAINFVQVRYSLLSMYLITKQVHASL